ncbi:MAG: hypothetical protein Q4C49_04160 [Bacillota bacterium]|nr:hypothetical protein [Bacillota bacterium]
MREKNKFTKAYIKPMVQAWLSAMECTQDSPKRNRMFIEYECGNEQEAITRYGVVQFWDRSTQNKEQHQFYGDIMELSVYEVRFDGKEKRKSIDPEFYLHFEMVDFEFVLEQISAFFCFLYGTNPEDEELIEVPNKIKRILICCTAGLTSGYFASLLQDKLDQDIEDNDIICEGYNVSYLPELIDEYDVVLLTPQIFYMYDELREKYGEKIQLIDRIAFATFNFTSVLEKLNICS